MSKSWDDLVLRVDGLEGRINAIETTERYPAPARRNDERLETSVSKAGRVRLSVRVGSLSRQQPEWSYTTFTFDASYPTGGETVTGLTTLAGTIQGVVIPPKNGYTFKYLAGKILAYTTAGTEVVDTTDMLAAVGTVDVYVSSAGQTDKSVYRALGDEVLVGATFQIGTAVTVSASNYWEISLRVRDTNKTRGVEIGSRVLTNARSLAADTPITLYGAQAPVALNTGDELVFVATAATNVAAKLDDVVVTLDFQRRLV